MQTEKQTDDLTDDNLSTNLAWNDDMLILVWRFFYLVTAVKGRVSSDEHVFVKEFFTGTEQASKMFKTVKKKKKRKGWNSDAGK